MVRGRVDQSLGAEGWRSHQGVIGLAMIFGCRGQRARNFGSWETWTWKDCSIFREFIYLFEKNRIDMLAAFYGRNFPWKRVIFSTYLSLHRGGTEVVFEPVLIKILHFSMRLHRYVCIAGQRCHCFSHSETMWNFSSQRLMLSRVSLGLYYD